MNTRIDDLTIEDIWSEGNWSASELVAFQTACRNYQRAHGVTESEAIDAIFWTGSSMWGNVHEWAPFEAQAADREK